MKGSVGLLRYSLSPKVLPVFPPFTIVGAISQFIKLQKPPPKYHGEEFSGWGCPSYWYNAATYPRYLFGAGFVLPVATLPCLYSEGNLIERPKHKNIKRLYGLVHMELKKFLEPFRSFVFEMSIYSISIQLLFNRSKT